MKPSQVFSKEPSELRGAGHCSRFLMSQGHGLLTSRVSSRTGHAWQLQGAGCWAGLGPPASSLSSLGLTKGHVLTLLPQWFPLGEPRQASGTNTHTGLRESQGGKEAAGSREPEPQRSRLCPWSEWNVEIEIKLRFRAKETAASFLHVAISTRATENTGLRGLPCCM